MIEAQKIVSELVVKASCDYDNRLNNEQLDWLTEAITAALNARDEELVAAAREVLAAIDEGIVRNPKRADKAINALAALVEGE